MRIDLTNYNATSTSKFRIYRSYSTFTEDKLPPVLVELPATETLYMDNTVELNKLAFYRISVVHNNNEMVGPLYVTMKKYYTGPQVAAARHEPDMILRGDARIGRYGTLTLDRVYPASQIPTDFPTLTIIEGVDVDATDVEKCIFDDKILFISDKPIYMGSLADLYATGMLFSNADGDGKARMTSELYDSITTKVNQGRLIHANGFTYRPRLLTEVEYNQLYVKLYPSSYLGGLQECVISNCIPHTQESVVMTTNAIGKIDNKSMRLNGQAGKTDWVTKRPLLIVLELVSRADAAFPDPEYELKPVSPDDKMMFCGGELVNNRVHFFGGIENTYTTDLAATTRHVSFDIHGQDEKVHAPMPVGVYRSVTWTHNNKIYSFGGVVRIGTTMWGYNELYNNVQVWEDDGTPEGKWTVLTTNVIFGFDSCGTIYYDSTLDKHVILIIGGYDGVQPNISSTYYYADVTTFDGTFSKGPSYLGLETGGGVLKEYEGNLMFSLATRAVNGITNASRKITLPINPPDYVFASSVTTQGSELGTSKWGKMHVWRDTLLLFPTDQSLYQDRNFYFYQWSPNESRWLKIPLFMPDDFPYSTSYYPTSVFNGGRIYTLCSNRQYQGLIVTDLADPLSSPLISINFINAVVDRLYPPYAKVVSK